jgi:hypothetical protein
MSNEVSGSETGFDGPDIVLDALRRLSPTQPQIDRDRLMFLAGRASAVGESTQYSVLSTGCSGDLYHPVRTRATTGYGNLLWPAAASVLAATSLGLAITIAVRAVPSPPLIVVREAAPAQGDADAHAAQSPKDVVPSRRIVAPPVVAAALAPGENYLRTREVAFRMGLEALGSPGTTLRTDVPTYREMLENIAAAAGKSESSAARPAFPSKM